LNVELFLRLAKFWSIGIGVSAIVGVVLFTVAYVLKDNPFDALTYGVLGSLLLGATLFLWRKGTEDAIDARAIRRTGSGEPRPGDWVVIAGKAVALDQTMQATLSNRKALACHYQVIEQQDNSREISGRSQHLHMVYEGHHLVPTGIETPTGIIPLRALPHLVNLEKSGVGHGESRLDAVAIRANVHRSNAALAEIAAKEQDRIHVDWKYKDAESHRKIIRKEWVLPPDEQVCVFGRWDGEALVPSPKRPRGLPVYPGSLEQIRSELGGSSKLFFVLGAIPLLILLWWTYDLAA
jgi:hypothetical protein